ncbi:MAG TPA: sialidase family protein [Burkholderiaceae bacterium]|nr:sialidase family protein [Burkholderiaceae bacterium]
MTTTARRWLFACAIASGAALSACGGGDDPAPAVPAPVPSPVPPLVALPPLVNDASVRLSATTPFDATCTGAAASDTVYLNGEAEPYVAVNPRDPANWVATWQQDRWSGGSSNGLMTATTFDGGATWTRSPTPFSRCAGGNAGNGGDYQRSTDPWVTFAPDGAVFRMGLAVTGASFTAGSANAMLVSRSIDGGRTWGPISTLIRDADQFFNDKNSITADPTDPRYVYAVWDRLAATGGGPTMLARSTDGGTTWEGARAIYDPGQRSQTIGNVIAVLPNGTVVNVFTRIDTTAPASASLHVLVSADKGGSWNGPFRIADALAVGARDPDTGVPIRDGANLPQIAVAPHGHLWVAWQDARFSGGAHDGIALARSTDGGLNWSAPVQVNSAPSAQAFTPSVHVTANGTIGVTYYDLRSNSGDAASLPTELILARSLDGTRWTEHRISPPFELTTAPVSRGYFLGDYHGLASANNVFIPVYVRTNSGDSANRTDVFATPARSLAAVAATAGTARVARAAPAAIEPGTEFRQRVHDNIVRTMQRRVPGWGARFSFPPP